MTEHTPMNYSMPRIDRIPYAYRIPVSFFNNGLARGYSVA
jgi:hypothetical protein